MIEKGLEHTLRDILGRSEETVRAFDIKSEIAMLCFVLSVEAGQAFINLSQLGTTRPYLSLVLLVTFIAALFAYMSVLFPAQNPQASQRSAMELHLLSKGVADFMRRSQPAVGFPLPGCERRACGHARAGALPDHARRS